MAPQKKPIFILIELNNEMIKINYSHVTILENQLMYHSLSNDSQIQKQII